MRNRLLLSVAFTALLFTVGASKSSGYDPYVYENLQKSRDALLSQRAGLERTRSDLLGQLDRIQAKISRIDAYLKQVDGSIRDVDDALRALK